MSSDIVHPIMEALGYRYEKRHDMWFLRLGNSREVGCSGTRIRAELETLGDLGDGTIIARVRPIAPADALGSRYWHSLYVLADIEGGDDGVQ